MNKYKTKIQKHEQNELQSLFKAAQKELFCSCRCSQSVWFSAVSGSDDHWSVQICLVSVFRCFYVYDVLCFAICFYISNLIVYSFSFFFVLFCCVCSVILTHCFCTPDPALIPFVLLLLCSGERADHPGATFQPAKRRCGSDSQQLWDRQPGADPVCQLLRGKSASAASYRLRWHRHGPRRPSFCLARVSDKSVRSQGHVEDWCGAGCLLQHQQQGRSVGEHFMRQQGQHQHDVPAADRSSGAAGDWSHTSPAAGGFLYRWSREEERLFALYRWAIKAHFTKHSGNLVVSNC